MVDLRTELEAAQKQMREATEREAAISQILRAISSSPADIQPVLDAIAEHAARYCAAENAAILLLSDDRALLTARALHGSLGPPGHPLPADRTTLSGRAVVERRTIHVEDLQTETAEYPLGSRLAAELGFHTAVATPLLRDGVSFGAIILRRVTVQPFTEQQLSLLRTFADQAVIALENVRLFTETKDALDQQTATSEVLKVISRSAADLQPVFDSVVENSNRLCAGDDAFVYLGEGNEFRNVAAFGGLPELVEINRRELRYRGRGTLVGRVALEEQVVHIPDVLEDPEYTHHAAQRAGGFRTLLGVPMKRGDGALVGVIGVARNEVRPFTPKEIQLVETFAQQSVIAIENVRLFNETKEALERQRATADILYTISTSPTTDQPVLEAVARNALRFCGAEDVVVLLVDGDVLERRAHAGTMRVATKQGGPITRVPLVRETVSGRATLESRTIHVPDIQSSDEFPVGRELGRSLGEHANLAAPLLQQGKAMGVILLRRTDLRPFGEDAVALAEGFAAQAVIAIENVRLFNEIREKSGQLEIANRELAAASRHKSEFLASMSHELRTPLNAIIGFSDVLIGGMAGELDGKQTEYLEDIRSSGRHLLSLINDILDLSKVEAGRMELTLSEFSLHGTLTNAVTMIRERAAGHGVGLDLSVDGVDLISADERKVKQILFNLLSNAVKFTPDGGTISVRAVRQGSETLVSVRDTGVGIPKEDQGRIFEEFRQSGAASTRSAEAEGTGLGLALTKSFVELHGGRIWVESEIGKGSTFRFTIPLAPAAAP